MTSRLAPSLALALCALWLAGSAAAEMYRWTDASGREHFTMDLHRVPPEHRAEAERRAALEEARVGETSGPTVNTMTTPDSARVKRALRPRYSRPAAAAGSSCSMTHRREAQRLASDVAKWEKKVELQEQLESRLVRTEDRLRAENRAERYQIYLEQAQQAQEDFEDRMRQKGVAPGCYR
jgi:hypothetical protein